MSPFEPGGAAAALPVLVPSPEQRALVDSTRQCLNKRWNPRILLEQPPQTGEQRASLWRQLCTDLDLIDLGVPTDVGGAGAGAVELALVAEEFGRVLCPVPLLTVVGMALPHLVSMPFSAAADDLLSRVRAGAVIAFADMREPLRAGGLHAGRPLISGQLDSVLDADAADELLLSVDLDGMPTLLAVALHQAAVSVRSLDGLDPSRGHASVTMNDASARVVGSLDRADGSIADLRELLLAAELVGVSARALELAVEHAEIRSQFGRTIGSFQAVKHRCARMLIALEEARSLVRYAAWCIGRPGLDSAVPVAQAACSAGATAGRLTADLIKILGAIGFTWEHVAHLYFRRARADAAEFGGGLERRRFLAERVIE
ncbi:acyl-CoA dehydrogenase family protein [Nocardia sp. R6R-6]|uniref:acyl-CoA dehydrogenase family protein n=1 Tax=Nocardia sp. R6R-6 TaxID=3459303 RepID=UPI00403DAF2F